MLQSRRLGVNEGSVGCFKGEGQWPWAGWGCPEVLDTGGADAEGERWSEAGRMENGSLRTWRFKEQVGMAYRYVGTLHSPDLREAPLTPTCHPFQSPEDADWRFWFPDYRPTLHSRPCTFGILDVCKPQSHQAYG